MLDPAAMGGTGDAPQLDDNWFLIQTAYGWAAEHKWGLCAQCRVIL